MRKSMIQYLLCIFSVLLFVVITISGNKWIESHFKPSSISSVEASLKARSEDYSDDEIDWTNDGKQSASIQSDADTFAVSETDPLRMNKSGDESSVYIANASNLQRPNQSTNLSSVDTDLTSGVDRDNLTEIQPDQSENETESEDAPDAAETKTGFDIDESGMLTHFYDGSSDVYEGCLDLPENGCIGIREGAFLSYSGILSEIYIPSNISEIQEGAFAGLNQMEWYEVKSGNAGVNSIEGVVFCRQGTSLLAFPSAREGIYSVPNSVSYISNQAFYNTKIKQIDLLKMGYVNFGTEVFGPNNGAGVIIRVPSEYLEDYRNALSGYAVQIIGVG